MKHCSVARTVAVVTLASLLTVFALPAAAAPFGGVAADGIWSPTALFHWIQSVWAGWFGAGEQPEEGSRFVRIYDKHGVAAEPDGAPAASAFEAELPRFPAGDTY